MNELHVSAVVPALQTDAEGRLAVDLACVGCGYNLRGLRAGDVCPECAILIARSMEGRWLRFADPKWLNAIAGGATLLAAAALMGFASSYSLHAMRLLLSPSQLTRLSMAQPWVFLLVAGLWFLGYWRFSTPEPKSGQMHKNYDAALRWAATLQFLCYFANPLLWRFLSVFNSRAVMVIVPELLARGLWLVVCLVAMTYARSLALRLPDERLARSTGQVMRLLAVLTLASITITVIVNVDWTGSGRVSGPSPLMPVSVLIAYVNIPIRIWWLVLLLRYRSALKRAAADARSIRLALA